MTIPGETPDEAIAALNKSTSEERRTTALVVEQVAQDQPVDPNNETLEAFARAMWGARASMLSRTRDRGKGAMQALIDAIERAWSPRLWNDDLLRWSAVRYLEAIATIGAEDRIGAQDTLDRIGDGPRQSWTGVLGANVMGVLVGLYHRCTGRGETAQEARTRAQCGFGSDANEGRALWNGWIHQWAHGKAAEVPVRTRQAGIAWCEGPGMPGHPPESVDATFTTWMRADPEWAAMMGRNIEEALDDPAWDPATIHTQRWPEMLAITLYRRLWALAGEVPTGNPEYTAQSLAAECAVRGVEGAKTWVEAASNAAETLERTTETTTLRVASANGSR